jgi:thioredoxin-like negative regulator of GroEL
MFTNIFKHLSFVNELTPEDFDTTKDMPIVKNNKNKGGLVTIYRDDCPHCTTMPKTLEVLSEDIKNDSQIKGDINSFFISSMNTNNPKNTNVLQKLNVTGVPTAFLIDKKGNLTQFNGDCHSEQELKKALQSLPQVQMEGAKKKSKRKKRKGKKSKRKSGKKSKKKYSNRKRKTRISRRKKNKKKHITHS